MNIKLPLFFIITIFTILYCAEFWANRHTKTELHIFGKKVDMNLGLLLFTVFIDGAILAVLLLWLLGYLR